MKNEDLYYEIFIVGLYMVHRQYLLGIIYPLQVYHMVYKPLSWSIERVSCYCELQSFGSRIHHTVHHHLIASFTDHQVLFTNHHSYCPLSVFRSTDSSFVVGSSSSTIRSICFHVIIIIRITIVCIQSHQSISTNK